MVLPRIGVRLHGWFDELVVLVYLAGALALGLHGPARVIAFGGAAIHFLLTRSTAYPRFGAFAFSDHGPQVRPA